MKFKLLAQLDRVVTERLKALGIYGSSEPCRTSKPASNPQQNADVTRNCLHMCMEVASAGISWSSERPLLHDVPEFRI